MIARVGNDPCPLRLQNEWLSPCAASTLPSVGLEICASCATRGTCIRTHLFPTPCREAAITGFGDHPNASITRWPPLTTPLAAAAEPDPHGVGRFGVAG